ncbi:MAG: DUF1476 domain-containing protein [Rhodospirillaceae bacterium]|jgi:hypothetical protein|nr:DUF1476 domain-containing protein [Rhodospirillaceae bacterium]MBT4589893.1 DUF1476 domain-containing protein [Rhodospirillaceae bacterium]MBT4940494.1 DUF1476 domain-containing protein [Rhodospirillaceae bacterium]MBT5941676.1 DUF1476 domain-containing protein [Rhodospirillaceae bacterium]MBT7267376.1 DUF1476 domain-containing protein [Rhodospirillaceae bacterium]
MSDTFSDREKGFEAKFKLDQETEFKMEARRNKLLGLWLAEKLGLSESEVEAYAGTVIVSDLEEPGIEDVVRKCMADIEKRGANVSEQDIRGKIEEFNGEAHKQIVGE